MKKIILITLLFSALAGWTQDYNYEVYELYKEQANKASSLNKKGVVLASTGGASAIIGILLATNLDYIGPITGAAFITYGIIGISVGIPFAIVGSKRKKKYEEAMKSYNPSLTFGTTQNGIGLTLKL